MGKFVKKILLVCLSTAVFCACGKQDFNIDNQNTRIESYLNGLDVEYTRTIEGAYKYTYHDAESSTRLVTGDSLYFYFSGYEFNSGPRSIYTTNILEDAVGGSLDETFLDFSPRKIKLGDGKVPAGVQLALPGSGVGDSLWVFMASDLAYDDKQVGVINPGTPIAFKIVIDKIIK